MSGVVDLLWGARSDNAQVRLWPGIGFRAAPCERYPNTVRLRRPVLALARALLHNCFTVLSLS